MKYKMLNGIHLKIIACAAMLIDHTCNALYPASPVAHTLSLSIGRMAFPIFAFLLLEGFLHTRSRKKYALDLLIAALISEIPFDMTLHGVWFYPGHQNTCFTLLLGLLFFMCLEKFESEGKLLYMIAAAAGFGLVFRFSRVDYGLTAFACFFVLYMLKYQQPAFTALIIATIVYAFSRTAGAYLCVIPFVFYNRQRGNMPARAKYIFYAFYPAHLAILAAVKYLR